MQRQKLTENMFLFLAIWFLIPLALMLLIDKLKLHEQFEQWVNGLW